MPSPTRITAVDTAHPPNTVSLQLDEAGHIAVILVAPGHSATLVYPKDSTTNNQLGAGQHVISIRIPEVLVLSDSQRAIALRTRDTTIFGARRSRPRATAPLLPSTPTYLLVVSSPQPLSYPRIIEKTAGVSIPLDDQEALNAVGKAVKATLPAEPRALYGFYQLVALRPPT